MLPVNWLRWATLFLVLILRHWYKAYLPYFYGVFFSPSSIWYLLSNSFMALCVTLSLRLLRTPPIHLLPSGDLSLAIFISLSSAILIIWLFQSFLLFSAHLFIPYTPYFSLVSELLLRSLNAFPVIFFNILISVVFNSLYVLIVSGDGSDVYVIIGVIIALYVFHFVSGLMCWFRTVKAFRNFIGFLNFIYHFFSHISILW